MTTKVLPFVVSATHRSDEGAPSHKGGLIAWKSPRQRDLVALEIGREIFRVQNAVQLECRGDGSETVIQIYVDVLMAYPNNERPALAEPAQSPVAAAPALPSASPPTREPDRERIEELRQTLDKVQSLAGHHADYEDWATAYVLSQTSVDLLRRIVEELEV
jgi:hypothetical protein